MTKTTMTVDSAVVRKLARLKVHPRESYTAVILKLLKKPSLKKSDVDKIDGMLATAEILSDPESISAVAAIVEVQEGSYPGNFRNMLQELFSCAVCGRIRTQHDNTIDVHETTYCREHCPELPVN